MVRRKVSSSAGRDHSGTTYLAVPGGVACGVSGNAVELVDSVSGDPSAGYDAEWISHGARRGTIDVMHRDGRGCIGVVQEAALREGARTHRHTSALAHSAIDGARSCGRGGAPVLFKCQRDVLDGRRVVCAQHLASLYTRGHHTVLAHRRHDDHRPGVKPGRNR